MRVKHLVLAAAVAVTSLVAPANATPQDGSGFSCGFSALRDQTDPQGTAWQGEASCGPWIVTDPTVSTIEVSFWLQVNCAAYDACGVPGNIRFRVSATTNGPVAVAAFPIQFTAAPSEAIYMCVHYRWTTTGGGVSNYQFDDDPTVPDPQCSLAIQV